MSEFLSIEALCDSDMSDEELTSTAAEYFAQFDESSIINDNVDEPDLNATPPKTPWEITCMLDNEKRVRDITSSIEKCELQKSPPKKIKPRVLFGGQASNVYSYELDDESEQQINDTLTESEQYGLLDSEEQLKSKTTEIADEASLRSAFFRFAVEGEKQGARWFDLMKNMKSAKTMQKNWAIFCPRPLTGLREGPYRSHVALEALLCNDADGIRARHSDYYTFYILEYRQKSRSVAGLKKLLEQVKVKTALIAVPQIRKPLVREWAKVHTSVLSEDPERDVTWLDITQNVLSTKFNPEELILFCEETEPASVEILIANYRAEAGKGNENAQAWIEQVGAYNTASNAFKMWKATVKGMQMQLSLAQFVDNRLQQITAGDPKKIRILLGLQEINELCFLNILRKWMTGKAKKNTLCIVGPGNSGKSMLGEALMLFLDGGVLSYQEHNTFWKQTAIGKRFAFLDDVTLNQWRSLDVNERRVLDGGVVNVNKKFSEAVEVKFPPLLITTNYYLPDEGHDFDFIINRLTWIIFKKPIPTVDGIPRIIITKEDIAAWFDENKETLDLD